MAHFNWLIWEHINREALYSGMDRVEEGHHERQCGAAEERLPSSPCRLFLATSLKGKIAGVREAVWRNLPVRRPVPFQGWGMGNPL